MQNYPEEKQSNHKEKQQQKNNYKQCGCDSLSLCPEAHFLISHVSDQQFYGDVNIVLKQNMNKTGNLVRNLKSMELQYHAADNNYL